MDNATIQEFLDEHDYDIRKTHNGRWIDQKCTMDVVCLVSDCIVEYTSGRNRKSFTVNDIWYNDYTVDNVQQIFSKPNPTEKASNEYDKYFGQPIKLLDAAGIIHGEKSGHGYVYSIVNQDLLEYISFRERNCYNFLCLYIEKVLRDSGIYRMFEYFFRLQDKNSFKELKDSYTSFTIQNTPINGATELNNVVDGMSYDDKMILVHNLLVDYEKDNEEKRDTSNKGSKWTDEELKIILSDAPTKENCVKYARLFKRGYGSIEQIYRWSVTTTKEMTDERKSDSFILQVKRIAKELGIRG